LLKNSSLNLASGIVKVVGGILSTAILSSTWTPSDFGTWAYVFAIAGMSLAFDFGLAIYAGSLSNASEKRQEYHEEIGRILTLAFVVAALVTLVLQSASGLVAGLLQGEESKAAVKEAIRVSCVGLVGGRMITSIGLALLSSQSRYNQILIISLFQSGSVLAVNTLTMVLRLDFARNLHALSFLNCAWALIVLFISVSDGDFYCLRRGLALRDISFKKLIQTLKKSLAVFPGSFGSSCFVYLDKLIVGSFIGAQDLAFYTVATMVAGQINSVTALIAQPIIHLVPTADSDVKIKDNLDRYAKLVLVSCPALGFLLILFAPIIRIVFFPALSDVSQIAMIEQVIAIMCFIYSIYSVNCYGHYYCLARQRYKFVSAVTMFSSFGTLALMFVVRGAFGLLGLVACNFVYATSVLLTVQAIRSRAAQVQLALCAGALIYAASLILIFLRFSHSREYSDLGLFLT
jgi:O-antigen/teichoic acid export membrane protein